MHTGKEGWEASYYDCSLSPRGKQPEFPVHCIGTGKLSNQIECKHTGVEQTTIHLIGVVPAGVSVVTHQFVLNAPAVVALEFPSAWLGCRQVGMEKY